MNQRKSILSVTVQELLSSTVMLEPRASTRKFSMLMGASTGDRNFQVIRQKLRVDVDRLAARIVTAACELDAPVEASGDDAIFMTMKDLEAVVHRHVTVALEEKR